MKTTKDRPTGQVELLDKSKIVSVHKYGSEVQFSRIVGTREIWGTKLHVKVHRDYYNASRSSLIRLGRVLTRMNNDDSIDIYLYWDGYEVEIWR